MEHPGLERRHARPVAELAEALELLEPAAQRALGGRQVAGEPLDVAVAECRRRGRVEARAELLVGGDRLGDESARLVEPALPRDERGEPAPAARRDEGVVTGSDEQLVAALDRLRHRHRAGPGGEAEPAHDLRLLTPVAGRPRMG